MKKFTSLLMLFCMFVGTALAQLVETSTEDAPKYYLLGSFNRGGYLTNAGVGQTLSHVDIVDASYWYFEKANDNGGVYIVNKVKDGENKVYASHNRQSSTTPEVWYILENGVNKFGVSISTTNPISGSSCIDANNHNKFVGSWAPNSGDWQGTTWSLWTLENYNNILVPAMSDAIYNPNGLSLKTRSDRHINSISLVGSMGNATVALNHGEYMGGGLVYLDKTANTIKVVAGEELTASVATGANWMNTYAYIDTDGTPGFSASIAGDGFTPADDLVSYSFYSGNETNGDAGKNSAGTELTGNARNTKVLPAFKAPSTPGTYRMRIKLDWNSINPNGGNANFMNDGGSFVDVTLEVIDPNATVDVVYNFVYGGETKYTQTSSGQVGEEYPEITVANEFVYGVSAEKPAGVIASNDVVEGTVTKTIELTENLPFVAAASYNGITNWYYVKIKDASYLSYAAGLDHIDLANKDAVDTSNRDAYTWAFIGNPFDGFQVVNMAAGSGKILSSSTTMNGQSGEGTWPIMTETPVAEGNNTYWTLTATTANIANGFFMGQKGYADNRMNNRGDKLAYWTGGADGGSTFTVVERDFSGATELQAIIDQVEAFVAAGVNASTTVGYITSESVTEVAAALAAAKNAVETKTGCNEAQVALQAAVAAVETIQPEEGKFYTIQNAYSSVYMYVSDEAGMKSVAEPSMASVFTFVKGENGELYLKNVERGSYTSTAPVHTAGQAFASAFTTENAKAVTIKNLGVANQVSITPNGGATLHHDVAYSNIVGWNGGANSRSAWVITEVSNENLAHTVIVGAAGYSTLVLGYNAVIPEGVKAYAVSATEDGWAKLAEVTGVLAAGEAVVLEAAEGTYDFEYTTEAATEVEGNLLVGTVFNTNVAADAYVLANGSNGLGFYLATKNQAGNTAFKNNAFKAYLPVGVAGARFLGFDFGTETGIGEVETETENAVIFDLAGRRVQKAQKGLYIVNGKKVIR